MLVMFVPVCCTPVGRIVILKGEMGFIKWDQILTHLYSTVFESSPVWYMIFVSQFTQNKLKDGQKVTLPINES